MQGAWFTILVKLTEHLGEFSIESSEVGGIFQAFTRILSYAIRIKFPLDYAARATARHLSQAAVVSADGGVVCAGCSEPCVAGRDARRRGVGHSRAVQLRRCAVHTVAQCESNSLVASTVSAKERVLRSPYTGDFLNYHNANKNTRLSLRYVPECDCPLLLLIVPDLQLPNRYYGVEPRGMTTLTLFLDETPLYQLGILSFERPVF